MAFRGMSVKGLGIDKGQWPGAPLKASYKAAAKAQAPVQAMGPPPIPETGWKLPAAFPSLAGQGIIALDIETYDPDLETKGPGEFRDGYIVGIAIGTEAGFRGYFPIAHAEGPNLEKEKVLEWLSAELGTNPAPKIGANIIYDLSFLAEAGVHVRGPFYDVQIAEPLLDENRLDYSLESLAQKYLKEGKRDTVMAQWIAAAYGKKKVKYNIWRTPPSLVGPYAESDVDLPLRIFAKQKTELELRGLWDLFILETKLVPILLAMRRRGIPVDLKRAETLKKELALRQSEVLSRLKDMTGISVDIWAAESIAKIFTAAGIAFPRTPKSDAPSFRKGWLEACPAPEAKLIVEARRLAKFSGTFVQGYILDGSIEGRIHCQFLQLRGDDGGTVSGRFSSANPNLQNVPIRDEELGPLMRAMFIAEPGEHMWAFDWSQIEFRLGVHFGALIKPALPGIEKVVEQYRNDPSTDYHEFTAKLSGLKRQDAKHLNFGFVYGMGVLLLASRLGLSMEEAKDLLARYHEGIPFIRPLYDKAMKKADESGEITTILGRKRRFTMFTKGNAYAHQDMIAPEELRQWHRAFTHKALNALLQGSAADIMKKGMVQIWESGVCDVLGAPHLTVHDELVGSFIAESLEAQEAIKEVKHIMETCVPLIIPLRADGGTGFNWGEVK